MFTFFVLHWKHFHLGKFGPTNQNCKFKAELSPKNKFPQNCSLSVKQSQTAKKISELRWWKCLNNDLKFTVLDKTLVSMFISFWFCDVTARDRSSDLKMSKFFIAQIPILEDSWNYKLPILVPSSAKYTAMQIVSIGKNILLWEALLVISSVPARTYLFHVSNRSTNIRCENCSGLRMKTMVSF